MTVPVDDDRCHQVGADRRRPAGPPVDHSPWAPLACGRPDPAATGDDLGAVLTEAGRNRFTGMVEAGQGGAVWLVAGGIYLALSPNGPSATDTVLAAEVIDPAELEVLWQRAEHGGDPVLDQLAQRHPEAAVTLRRLLHEHNLAALLELLATPQDRIEARPGPRHVLGSRYPEPVDRLLGAARSRLELRRRIARHVPSPRARFRLARRAPGSAPVTVPADDWAVLALLDGRRTVAELIAETGEDAFRLCALLHRMVLEGLIEPA